MPTNKVEILSNDIQRDLKGKILDFSSRFNQSRLISYSDFKILTFETYDRTFDKIDIDKIIFSRDILFFEITKGTQYRPWLVSQDAYGDPGYWWYIMEFNDIFDVEEFTAGKTIQIPPLSAIQTANQNKNNPDIGAR
jgi:hypothetical protein